jgi:hypothetical protein
MNVHDTVGINIEGNFNLWNTSGSRGNTIKTELTKFVAILGKLTFSFKDLNKYSWLVISISCEDLGFLCGDCSISGNKNGHNTTSGFNTKRKWSNI